MAVKPDKSRIMFTTDSSFESFLRDRCYEENRNMSNLVDTILKGYYAEQYSSYMATISLRIKRIVSEYYTEAFVDDFMEKLTNSKISLDTRIYVRNKLAHANGEMRNLILELYNELNSTINNEA